MNEAVFIHESAIVDIDCKIGTGTKIWHFCHIMSGSEIGENCVLGQNVLVAPGVVLGNGVKVQNNVSLYTGFKCEDDVFLGPSCVFTNVINPRSAINRKTEFANTIVKKGATIGANATILCGLEIGKHAFVGAGAVVTHQVPDFALVIGNPARQRGWMSVAGRRLDFNSEGHAVCPEGGDLYQLTEAGTVIRLSGND